MKTLSNFFLALFLVTVISYPSFSQGYWKSADLSEARKELAVCHVGDKVVFAGGFKKEAFCQSNAIDIYDMTNDIWLVDTMGGRREEMKVAVAGNRAVFIGWSGVSSIGRQIDVYDSESNSVQSYDSPSGEPFYTATSAGDFAYFVSKAGLSIYDGVNDLWSLKEIPDLGDDHRIGVSSAFYEGKIYYAGSSSGGVRQPDVSIYDTASDTWSIDSLSVGRSSLQVLALDKKVYFIAGILTSYSESDVMDIYDTETGMWTIESIPTARFSHQAEVFDNKLYIAGGYGRNFSPVHNVIEIYDPNDSSWSSINMEIKRGSFDMATADDQLFIAGAADQTTTLVEIYTLGTSSLKEVREELLTTISPNPTHDIVTVKLDKYVHEEVDLSVYNMSGHRILSKYGVFASLDGEIEIDASALAQGSYMIRVSSSKKVGNLLFQKL